MEQIARTGRYYGRGTSKDAFPYPTKKQAGDLVGLFQSDMMQRISQEARARAGAPCAPGIEALIQTERIHACFLPSQLGV